MDAPIDFAKVSPRGVLDIAIAAEQEAEEHYDGLVVAMERAGNTQAADFFRRMAGMENKHRSQLAGRRKALFDDDPPDLAHRYPWSVEVPGEVAGGQLTLQDALRVSLAAERRAYAYYTAAIEVVTDAGTEALFGELRDAEAGHARMIESEIAKVESR
jgi:erythrin-vacuolar iron transport family protein